MFQACRCAASPASPARWGLQAGMVDPRVNLKVDSGQAAGRSPRIDPARHYAESMDDKARSTPAGTAAAGTPDAAVVLRVLRVCLHSGFAVLLLVALVRLLGAGLRGPNWLTFGLALILAAVYVLGTVLEKRHSTDPSRFDPGP